ncbi:lactonase family protein [soil metagenome]
MKQAAWIALVIACGGSHPMSPNDANSRTDAVASDAVVIDAPMPAHYVAYISGYGPKIAWFDFEPATGALTPVGSLAANQASFLALTSAHAYAVNEGGNKLGAYAIDQTTGALTFINEVSSSGAGPAHVSVDHTGAFALVANYGGGTAAVVPIRTDGGLAAATVTVSPGTNAHMVITDPANKFAFVPCQGSDFVAQYTFVAATGALAANAVPHLTSPAGAGPRHLAFAPDGHHAYLVAENASTLMALAYDANAGRLATIQTLSTRAAGATGTNTGAEVAVHPNGKFVYASNRGDNNIAVFSIDASNGMVAPIAHTPAGGMTPRMFAIDPTGAWLFVANQTSSTVTTFAIAPATGLLTAKGSPLAVAQPSFVGFVALPPR